MRMIHVFTPSFADAANSNAQNLTVKEVVSRLPPDRFRVSMLSLGPPDPRISQRPNTSLLKWSRHGNTLRSLLRCLISVPDIYFFPREGPLDHAFLSARRRFRLPTALVTYLVSGGMDQGAIPPFLLLKLREAQAAFANNRHLSEILQQRTGLAVGTIYDGVDRRYFYPNRSAPGQPLTVLYAGSFRPYKRAHLVVRQAARHPKVQFRLAGSGEEEAACRQLALDLGCVNLDFLGHLPQERLGQEMRSAHVFFFPSALEGHPQVLLQAAACGLPCIAMKSYRPDYVRDGSTGYLADSDEDLSAKLDRLLQDSQLRGIMSAAAAEHARAFDWDVVTQRWEEVFEAVAPKSYKYGPT